MPQITKLDLGVSLIKDGVDITTIPYRSPSEFGWEPGWEPFEVLNLGDYLHQDLIDLLGSLGIPYMARLNRVAPGFQYPVAGVRPGPDPVHIAFSLIGSGKVEIFDLVGYNTGSILSSPYPVTDPDFKAEYLMKPGTVDGTNPLNYLKPGDIGLDGNPVVSIESSTYPSVMFGAVRHSLKNTSLTDYGYGLFLVTYNVTKEYVQSALLPYVVE
jgi:hypothetical protein